MKYKIDYLFADGEPTHSVVMWGFLPIGFGFGDTGSIPVVPRDVDLQLLVFDGLNLKLRVPFSVQPSFHEDILRFPRGGVERRFNVPVSTAAGVTEDKIAEITAKIAKIDADYRQNVENYIKTVESVDPERAYRLKSLQFQ